MMQFVCFKPMTGRGSGSQFMTHWMLWF